MKSLIFIALLMTSISFADLSREQIKEVISEYSQACINQNHVTFNELCLSTNKISEYYLRNALNIKFMVKDDGFLPKQMKINKIEGLNVLVQITQRNGHKDKKWVQLTPEGKIKYEPFVHHHPINKVALTIMFLQKLDYDEPGIRNKIDNHFSMLNNLNIPTFGYDQNSTNRDIERIVEKLNDWLEDEGKYWDKAPPLTPLPESSYKEMVRGLKNWK